jgi:hypothetical protein
MPPAFVRKGMTKILQNGAFISYASTFLHLQPCLTQFFLANQTSFKDLTAFFIDDRFFDKNIK